MYHQYACETLAKIISYDKRTAEGDAAVKMFEKYGTLGRIFGADLDILSRDAEIGEEAAHLTKLVGAVLSRAKTEQYKFGVKHTSEETSDFFKALFLTRSVECIYAMSLDKNWSVKGCDLVGEGVVNVIDMLPRKIVEIALKRKAKYMILAHNHPHGVAKASDDDVVATMNLSKILDIADVKLVGHIVVAGNDCCYIGTGV